MAGMMLDDLVDALSDEEASSQDSEAQEILRDPEDFMRRAVQMANPQPKIVPGPDASVSPEEKIDYYRRMVQMHEMMRSGGYESVSQITEEDGDTDARDGGSKSLNICTDFLKAGDCKAGLNCTFVHDGAFRKGGVKEYDEADVSVDPEDFIRRALQLRSLQQKSSRKAATRVPESMFSSFLPGW